MIDTHCHLLPGIDDGAKDDADAVAMARIAVEDGIRAAIVTPHMREGDFLNERPKVLEAVERYRALLDEAGVHLTIHPGSEVHLGPRLAERIEAGRLLTIADGKRYLLLELPARARPTRIEETVFELRLAGVTPVIAHPERIRFFQDQPSAYEELVRLGGIGQLTASSLSGDFGRALARLSEDWVSRGLVHILGSDAHDQKYRPPRLSRARERWAELAGEESAERAVAGIAGQLILGEEVIVDPPTPPRRSRSLIGRLFGR